MRLSSRYLLLMPMLVSGVQAQQTGVVSQMGVVNVMQADAAPLADPVEPHRRIIRPRLEPNYRPELQPSLADSILQPAAIFSPPGSTLTGFPALLDDLLI